MTQCDLILLAMINNSEKEKWTAKDFQYGDYFVGYEATARMSDLMRLYPQLFKVGKEGRFRTLTLDWTKQEEIENIRKELEEKKK